MYLTKDKQILFQEERYDTQKIRTVIQIHVREKSIHFILWNIENKSNRILIEQFKRQVRLNFVLLCKK